jgi:hypothetical protein
MVRALEGDSTITSLVPPPLLLAGLVAGPVPVFVFVFAVAVLAGTLLPVLASAW